MASGQHSTVVLSLLYSLHLCDISVLSTTLRVLSPPALAQGLSSICLLVVKTQHRLNRGHRQRRETTQRSLKEVPRAAKNIFQTSKSIQNRKIVSRRLLVKGKTHNWHLMPHTDPCQTPQGVLCKVNQNVMAALQAAVVDQFLLLNWAFLILET